jgi:hypothetical protein
MIRIPPYKCAAAKFPSSVRVLRASVTRTARSTAAAEPFAELDRSAAQPGATPRVPIGHMGAVLDGNSDGLPDELGNVYPFTEAVVTLPILAAAASDSFEWNA